METATMKLNQKHNLRQQELDSYTFEHSLWKKVNEHELSEGQVNFLSMCMTENLEHARHVENERLTFNSIFLALVAGAMAFADSLHHSIAFGIYFFLTVAGFLSMVLTVRWNNAFNRHIFYAQKCYKMLHIHFFGDADECPDKGHTDEVIDGLNDIPLYCFKISRPIAYTKLGELLYKPRTKHLYISFYWIIQILIISCTLMEFFKFF